MCVESSTWIAVRCFENLSGGVRNRPGGRFRFAHTAPFHIDVRDKPLRPRRCEVEFLVRRVKDQIRRSKDVMPGPALEEYRQALEIYERIAKTARD